MTLEQALDITGIRQQELTRVNTEAINEVIELVEREALQFPYDRDIKYKLLAYKTIRKELRA